MTGLEVLDVLEVRGSVDSLVANSMNELLSDLALVSPVTDFEVTTLSVEFGVTLRVEVFGLRWGLYQDPKSL